MRTLHLYLLRQVLATLLMTVGVFTLVLLMGNVLREILDLLASGQATAMLVVRAIGLLIPFVLAFSLPMGLLTAALLVFGRFSADQELTAVRAGGISLLALIRPLLLLSVLLSGVCAVVNLWVAPASRVAFKNLRDSVLRTPVNKSIPEGRYVELGNNLTLYAAEVRGRQLHNLLIYGTTNLVENGTRTLVRNLDALASDGELVFSNGLPVSLKLQNVQALRFSRDEGWQSQFLAEWEQLIPNPRPATAPSLKLNEMTFTQLRAERRERAAKGVELTLVDVQIHRQLAFSLACIGFTLVGIPLGIRAHRRETNAGVGIALLLVLAYYSFIILGQALETRPNLHPVLILWLPNFLFIGAGVLLLRRANRAA
ncbi:MAG TPA: LptF/LptG family permease [Candidatus Limnocylindria bacterium]|nr:LptF/LptG family permease [Candidatus Limnocylindria bacterium]